MRRVCIVFIYYVLLSFKSMSQYERQTMSVPSAGETRKLVSLAAVLPAVVGSRSVEIQTTQSLITRGKRVSTRANMFITKHKYRFRQPIGRWFRNLMIHKSNPKTLTMVLLLTHKPESCSHTLFPWSAPFCLFLCACRISYLFRCPFFFIYSCKVRIHCY